MKVLRYAAAAVVAGLFSQGALAACYVVYNADKEMVYRSPEPPVDLSRPLHQTLPEVAPGGSLVFSLDNFGCEAQFNKLPMKSQAAKPATAAKKAKPA
jgi:hypothetical protein